MLCSKRAECEISKTATQPKTDGDFGETRPPWQDNPGPSYQRWKSGLFYLRISFGCKKIVENERNQNHYIDHYITLTEKWICNSRLITLKLDIFNAKIVLVGYWKGI